MSGDDPAPTPRLSVPTTPPPDDLALLKILASGRPAVAASTELQMPMQKVAERLHHLRDHYGVLSTAAALHEAAAHGHL